MIPINKDSSPVIRSVESPMRPQVSRTNGHSTIPTRPYTMMTPNTEIGNACMNRTGSLVTTENDPYPKMPAITIEQIPNTNPPNSDFCGFNHWFGSLSMRQPIASSSNKGNSISIGSTFNFKLQIDNINSDAIAIEVSLGKNDCSSESLFCFQAIHAMARMPRYVYSA